MDNPSSFESVSSCSRSGRDERHPGRIPRLPHGEVAEWLNVPAWKAGERDKRSEGSNPSLSECSRVRLLAAAGDAIAQSARNLLTGKAAMLQRHDEPFDGVAQRARAFLFARPDDLRRDPRAAPASGDDPAFRLKFGVGTRDRVGSHPEIAS